MSTPPVPATNSFPSSPDLTQLRHQAKDLLRALRAGDPGARARYRREHPRATDKPDRLGLSDAQWILAREYGFPSWAALKRHLETLALGGAAIFNRGGRSMRYEDRGVSADKTEVHAAIRGEDPGLYPGAFCKILPDDLTGSPEHCMLVHADGAGTKSILAYFHFKETGDPSAFRGIAQDALVMNLDDLACVGARGPFLVSNTIGRNAKLVPGSVIEAIIAGYRDCFARFGALGLSLRPCGGETADVGDSVRTLLVDCTVVARERRDRILTGERIRPGLAIVGLHAGGRASYEDKENSGLGSNGLTAVRHELLAPHYRERYPEAYAPEIADLAYTGKFRLGDALPGSSLSLGEALLSPTRSYAPVILRVLEAAGDRVAAVFNNTGGGQTKCLRFGRGVAYVKENPMPLPPLFAFLRAQSSMGDRELFRTLNMGVRMEVLCEESAVQDVIRIAEGFNIQAARIGRTEASGGANAVVIRHEGKEYRYALAD